MSVFSKICDHSVASTNNAAFLIIGSTGQSYSDLIAQLKDNEWSLNENLLKRYFHRSITSGDKTMVIV